MRILLLLILACIALCFEHLVPAKLCTHVYEEGKKVPQETVEAEIRAGILFARLFTVANEEKKLYLAIRGTDSEDEKDVQQNFKITMQPFVVKHEKTGKSIKAGSVHAGFLEKATLLVQKILPLVKPFVDRDFDIIVAGHSQGGANAYMTGMYLRLALDARVSIVTFGAPKPGNAAFRDAVEKYVPNTTRYVLFYRDKTGTADDFATTLPFAFMGYTHLGKEVRAQCTAKDNGKCHSMKQYLYDLPSARLETITVQQEHTNEFEGLASILSAFSGQEEK